MIDPGAWSVAYDDALCRELVAVGCDVDLLTSRAPRGLWPQARGYRRHETFASGPGVSGRWRYLRLGARRGLRLASYPLGWWRTARILQGRMPQIVHLQWSPLPAVDRIALDRIVKRIGAVLVVTAHNAEPRGDGRGRARHWQRLLSRADARVALCGAVGKVLDEARSRTESRTHVIPLAVSKGCALSRLEARERLGLDPDAPTVLLAGLLRPYKGVDVLLEAFSVVAGQLPEAQLVVAGLPRMRWQSFADQIDRLGLGHRIRCELDYLPKDRFELELAAADVVALPYLSASQSAVLAAAIGTDRAVVASDVGGLAEQLGREGQESLVPPGDVPALAAALRLRLSDRAASDALGRRVGVAARKRWSWERSGLETVALYRELLDGMSES